MISGIYQIRNITDDKVYVGSSVNIQTRFNTHKMRLRKNVHHSKLLQNAWNKYGEDNFIFEIIEVTQINQLLLREQFYLDLKKVCMKEFGYNINPRAGSNLGIKLSDSTKRKMSIAKTGKIRSDSSKLNMSIAAKNRKPISDETRKKMSDSRLGKPANRLRLKLINIETQIENIVYNMDDCLSILNIPISRRTTIYSVLSGKRESINGYKIINLKK